jgi:hypothetical protein
MRWAGIETRMGINTYNILVEKPNGRGHLEGLCLDEMMIPKWILKDNGGLMFIGFIRLRIWTIIVFLRIRQ